VPAAISPAPTSTPPHKLRAYKQHRKIPFLETFTLHHEIKSAAQAVGISRFAVDDWRRDDPVFARAFVCAERMSEALAAQVHERITKIWSKLGKERKQVCGAPLTSGCKGPDGLTEPIGAAACGGA
jgi:hypothetical protein